MESSLRLVFAEATPADAAAVASVRVAAAQDLTSRFGSGHWSGEPTERGVLSDLKRSKVWLVRRGKTAVGTFRVSTRKPWAIDASYFTPCELPLYLTDMAVEPTWQRRGVGRRCLDELVRIAQAWPANAIRLDAYDAAAGAGSFYEHCGFRRVGGAVYRGVPLLYYELIV